MSENNIDRLIDNSQTNTTIRTKIHPLLKELADSHGLSVIDTLTALVGFCFSLPREERVELLNKGIGIYGLVLIGAEFVIDMPEEDFAKEVNNVLKDAPNP